MVDDQEILRLLGWVASAFDDQDELRARAKQAGAQMTSDQLAHLDRHLNTDFPKPPEALQKFEQYQIKSLGAWINYRHDAIFAICREYPTITLPLVRRVAFGDYDWSQFNAIYTLCHWVNEGVLDARSTVNELIAFYPQMRDTAQDKTLWALATIIKVTLPEVIEFLTTVVQETLQTEASSFVVRLLYLAKLKPVAARQYRAELLQFMNDTFYIEDNIPPQIDDSTEEQVNAVIILRIAYPEEREFEQKLIYWSLHHQRDELRKISQYTLEHLDEWCKPPIDN